MKFAAVLTAAFFCVFPVLSQTDNYAYFNVKDYGAFGDGEADDTAAIQAAVDAAYNSYGKSGTVYMPRGVYVITDTITLYNCISILGDGHDDSPGGSVIKAGASLPSMIRTAKLNGHHLNIENLTFDGGEDTGWTIGWVLDLQDFLGSRVAGIKIHNVSGGGIYSRWTENYAGSWVNWFVNSQIQISGNYYALRLGSSDSYVNGLVVTGGMGLLEERYGGNLYRRCKFENCYNGITVTNPEGYNCNIAVSECLFENNLNAGISFSFADADFNCFATVTNCDFSNNYETDIELNNASNISIAKNRFKSSNPACGYNVKTTGVSDRISFTDNLFAAADLAIPGYNSCSVGNEFSVSDWPADSPQFWSEAVIWNPGPDGWMRVDFSEPFDGIPVVIAQTVSARDPEPCVTRVRNVDCSGFELLLEEWDYLDGVHAAEVIHCFAIEQGRHSLDGLSVEAVRDVQAAGEWDSFEFAGSFETTPIVFAQLAGDNDINTAVVRIKDIGVFDRCRGADFNNDDNINISDLSAFAADWLNQNSGIKSDLNDDSSVDYLDYGILADVWGYSICSTQGFKAYLQNQESSAAAHGTENINYIGISPGWSKEGDIRVGSTALGSEARWVSYGSSFKEPFFLGSMQSCNDSDTASWRFFESGFAKGGVECFIEEEQSLDSEAGHLEEDFGYAAFGKKDIVTPMGRPVINVKDYGASGNAYADDTVAIQQAINTADAGDIVYLPKGAYKITSSIYLKSGVILLGDGDANTASKILAGADMPAMITAEEAVSGVYITKICFDGGSYQGRSVSNIFRFTDMRDSTLDRIRLINTTGSGIVLRHQSRRNYLRSCTVHADGWGIWLDGWDCIVEDGYCSGGYGSRISGAGGHRIFNSHFDRALIAAILFEDSLGNPRDVLVRNCYMDLNSIALKFDYDIALNTEISIENCIFRASSDTDVYINNANNISFEANSHRSSSEHFTYAGDVDYITLSGSQFSVPVSAEGVHSIYRGNCQN
ncbi:parallel beta-helix repeat-containing protein [Limihaloglobus sulfuriphilus]|uniref:Parallel beta-helix repeat-containing protein n=1 Tax=Limihaloglobus sulfuriphilus TaxID=1851148 RepID=A0A1Q2MEJ0_9BACT|nr:glycosyl hydrolase family 28-related protein [Limihaloglobus sulfuriphilus]AQQ70717.1 parallel beta-helix repeat-containing protein [Limihaloglobus sulfuriphilus]